MITKQRYKVSLAGLMEKNIIQTKVLRRLTSKCNARTHTTATFKGITALSLLDSLTFVRNPEKPPETDHHAVGNIDSHNAQSGIVYIMWCISVRQDNNYCVCLQIGVEVAELSVCQRSIL